MSVRLWWSAGTELAMTAPPEAAMPAGFRDVLRAAVRCNNGALGNAKASSGCAAGDPSETRCLLAAQQLGFGR